MRPVAVLQHMTGDGPSHLATFLRAQGVAFEVFDTEAGAAFPADLDRYAALAVLGGEMGANDPLPSLRQAERLILQAMERGVPVLGHCLGGQLMARALGATVRRSPAPEVGWHPVRVADDDEARAWFGDAPTLTVFQWHYDAFDLPPGTRLLATGDACRHQAFGIGPHLAMQFHVEIDEPKHAAWALARSPDYLRAQREWPTVHDGERMRRDAVEALPAQRRTAERVYRRWLALARG